MRMNAAFVTRGNVLCDVGCDHGYLAISLVESGVCPRAIAMDLRKDPLERARQNIADAHLSDKIETRLSDGVSELRAGEADTVLIAGLGGRTMIAILTRGADVLRSVSELVLQPQSEIYEVRKFLTSHGYMISDEEICEDDGKYYVALKVLLRGAQPLSTDNTFAPQPLTERELRYGQVLLLKRSPVFLSYLEHELDAQKSILRALPETQAERWREIQSTIAMLEEILR